MEETGNSVKSGDQREVQGGVGFHGMRLLASLVFWEADPEQ